MGLSKQSAWPMVIPVVCLKALYRLENIFDPIFRKRFLKGRVFAEIIQTKVLAKKEMACIMKSESAFRRRKKGAKVQRIVSGG